MNRWVLPLLGGLVVAIALFTLLGPGRSQTPSASQGATALIQVQTPASVQTATLQPGLLSESEAISRALAEARRYGLSGEPWGIAARQMTLLEAMRLSGADIPLDMAAQAAKMGRDPAKPVWLVAIRGAVQWIQPGGPGSFDNLWIILDAVTGQGIDYGAQGPKQPLLLYVPVTPGTAEVRITVTPHSGPMVEGTTPPLAITATPRPTVPGEPTARPPLPHPVAPPTAAPTMSPSPYPSPSPSAQP